MQKNGLSLILASFSIFSIMLVFFMTMSHGTSAAFFDVPATHPNSAAINYAQEQGIVGGYPDGSFQPDRILNRAEFAKIMIAARFSQGEIESCVGSPEFYQKKVLSDIEPGVWFEKYVCFAKKKGVIAGYPDGTFQGTRLINFAESAKISVESYGLEVGTGDPWFIPYLNELEERSAVPDSLARIGDPTQRGIMEITRGEMAEIVYRLRNIQDEVVSSDGALTMKISESALPEGVSLDTFSIRRMQEEENPLGTVNGAPMIFYDLGPDGFVFKQPITVQIN
ncbi:MAG: S-layer homology domain-containing protein, partial [Candidatus Gracilibacteria bacterium]|nr:S-layer homology domain-containing protein [Candidatus Gracilibacteria bacterium]